jgi:hypothetical protein
MGGPRCCSSRACSRGSRGTTRSEPSSDPRLLGLLGRLHLGAPRASAWATTAAMVVPASVRLLVMFEMRLPAWVIPMMNRFGKPCTCMPWSVRMPSAQCPLRGLAVAPGGLVARATGVLGADLEARGEDQAVERRSARRPTQTPVSSMRSTPLPSVSTRWVSGVVGLQVLVVEAGPLAELAVPGLEGFGGRPGPATIGVDPGADLGPSSRRRCPRRRAAIVSGVNSRPARSRHDPVADALGDVGPAVLAPGPRRRSRPSAGWRS